MTFYSNVIREFERSSGIEAVVFSRMPLDRLLADAVQIREGAGESAREFSVRMRAVSPKAFRLIGVPVVAGREFADDDGPGVPRAAMVNETLAKREGFPRPPVAGSAPRDLRERRTPTIPAGDHCHP